LSLQLGHEGDATPRWHLTTLVGLLLLVSASFFQTASSIARTQQGQGTLLWIPPLLLLMLSAGTAVFWVRRERWITRPECMRKVALAACIWAVVAIALIYSTLRANP
jgi:peptidoglycan/LPS O-acetylase OafA/YrhL